MNVSLPEDLVEFVKTELADGGYGNQSDVVRDGLRVLREQRQKRRLLMQLLNEGRAAVHEGKTKSLSDRVLRDIAKRGKAVASRRSHA